MQSLGLIFSLLKYAVIASVVTYFLVAVGLTMLAARLRSKAGWMAWIPLLNFFLLCRLAQSSWAWVLAGIIPFVGFIVLGYLGARVAKRLGQSGLVGALFGVPLLGAIVPIPLAIAGKSPAPAPGQTDVKPASLGLGLVGGMMGAFAVVLVGFVLIGWMTRGTPVTAAQATAKLPPHTVGTLTVFPIDTDKARPATPTNVVSQDFGTRAQAKASTAVVSVKKTQLPPWIAPDSLPINAADVTAADYRATPAEQPVSVVVLTMRDGESLTKAPTKQEIASAGPDAEVTGIEVKSVSGDTYRGYRVKSDDSAYYALQKNDSPTGVVITANKGADLAMAERLALGVANGKGLLEYEEYAGSFSELPAAPGGFGPGQVMTFTEADITTAMQQVNTEIAADAKLQDPAIADLITQARLLLPSRVSVAQYEGGENNRGTFAAVATYPSSRSAWVAMLTIGFFVSNASSVIETFGRAAGAPADEAPILPVVEAITIGGASGYTANVPGGSVILLRRGGSISLLASDSKAVDLKVWAASFVGAPGK